MFKQTQKQAVRIKRTMQWSFQALFIAALILATFILQSGYTEHAQALTNSTVNFQARLQKAQGNIVPDGKYNIQFKLYSASSGGTALWTESYYDANGVTAGSDNRVTTRNGYVSVALGSQTTFPSTINWDQELYLTMNIGGSDQTDSPTYDGEMNPRLKLTGVPYAFRAGQLAQFNSTTGFTSTLNLLQPTVGNQNFQIQDQGSAGTYNLCVQNSTACGFAAATGGSGYIQNQNALQQAGTNFWIGGTGRADTALQAPSFDTPSAAALSIGTTNATSVTVGKAGVNTLIGGNLSVGTTQSYGAITIANGAWFTSLDSAGTGSINMFSVNGSNQIQVGAALSIDGGIILPTNGGQMTLADLPIDSTAINGTKQSYSLRVGSSNALTVYGEADGSGNAQNVRVAVGSSIAPGYTLDVSGDVNISNGSSYRINGTQICTATGCAVASGNTNYIQNQNSGAQSSSNFWISGSGTAATSLLAPLVDTSSAGVLHIGTTNATSIALNKQVSVGVAGGGAANGKIVFNNGTNTNTVSIISGTTASSYALTLPTAIATTGECLKAGTVANGAVPLTWGTCGSGGGSASTLQDAYDLSGTASPKILLSDTNGGIVISDSSTGLSGSLLTIQNNAATASYLNLTSTALSLQDSAGNNALVFDSTTSHLKVYENGSNPTRYADMYYDGVTGEAVYSSSSGNTRVGNGSGNVTITLTNTADTFQFTKSTTLSGAYSDNDYSITRNITAGSNSLTGSVLKVESTSSGSGTVASDILWLNENNGGATGNIILGTVGGAGNVKFKVNTSGTVTIAAGASYTGAGAVQVSSGAGTALSLTSNAAATWGTSDGNLTLQAANSANSIVLNPTSNTIQIGTSDTIGTQLVLDTKTDAGDPASGVNGGMYYNSNAGKFRCYQSNTWVDCTQGEGLVRKTADQNATTSSTTFQNVTDMVVPVAVSSNYTFDMTFVVDVANTTADMKYTLLVPTGATLSATGTTTLTTGSGATAHACNMNASNTACTINVTVAHRMIVSIKGTVVTDATNSGNLQLQFAQNTSTAATNPIAKANSIIRWFKF